MPRIRSGILADWSLQRQKQHPADQVLGDAHFRDQFQIADAGADGYVQLMREDHTAEVTPSFLPAAGFHQQIVIVGEKHPPQLSGTVEQD